MGSGTHILEASATSWGAVLAVALFCLAWATRKHILQKVRPDSKTIPIDKSASGEYSQAAIEPLQDFDWTRQEPQKLFPFKPTYHITMGLRKDSPSNLITIDSNYMERIQIRKSIINNHPSTVHGCNIGGEKYVAELYTYLLSEYLPARYPSMFRPDDRQNVFHNAVTGATHSREPPGDPLLALRIIGTTVEEDFFLLRRTEDGHRCVAMVCCFPSGWDPSTKLGKTLDQIHIGVPSYEKIGPSMERYFSRLKIGESVKRVNWTIQTHDTLFNKEGNHVREGEDFEEEDVDTAKTFMRVEYQTLSKFLPSGVIVFSFKTYLYPIQQVKDSGNGPELADAIEGLQKGNAPGMWRYKSAVTWGNAVCDFLRK